MDVLIFRWCIAGSLDAVCGEPSILRAGRYDGGVCEHDCSVLSNLRHGAPLQPISRRAGEAGGARWFPSLSVELEFSDPSLRPPPRAERRTERSNRHRFHHLQRHLQRGGSLPYFRQGADAVLRRLLEHFRFRHRIAGAGECSPSTRVPFRSLFAVCNRQLNSSLSDVAERHTPSTLFWHPFCHL